MCDPELELYDKIKQYYPQCDVIKNDQEPYTLYCASDIGKILALKNINKSFSSFKKDKINIKRNQLN